MRALDDKMWEIPHISSVGHLRGRRLNLVEDLLDQLSIMSYFLCPAIFKELLFMPSSLFRHC